MPKPEIEGSCWLWWAVLILLVPLPWLCALCLAGFVHEFGHYLAVRLLGSRILAVSVSPGGIRMDASALSVRRSIAATLAGPAAGLLLILPARWLPLTAFCGCIQSLWNLLPLGHTDGSHVLRILLSGYLGSERAERITVRIGYILKGILLGLAVAVYSGLNQFWRG